VNAYLAPQFSGALVQAVIDGIQASHDAQLPLLDYWRDLSLSTATGADGTLDFIGCLAGYPRPIVPSTFYSANVLTLSQAALYPQQSILTGLGSVYFPGIGGMLTSVFAAASATISDSWYQALIPLAAQIKYYGLTIYTVDLIASFVTGVNYTIAFNNGGAGPDINLTFATDIGYQRFWILEQIFAKYATSVQVNVVNGISTILIAMTQGVGTGDVGGVNAKFLTDSEKAGVTDAVSMLIDVCRSLSDGVPTTDTVASIQMDYTPATMSNTIAIHESVTMNKA
jgi:hypothetical protein